MLISHLMTVLLPLGCSSEDGASGGVTGSPSPVRRIFPESAFVADQSVNDIVLAATQACLDGDYERFRSYWSATAEPVTRDQFERGWKHAELIEIHKIQGLREPIREAVPEGDESGKGGVSADKQRYRVFYYVHASITLASGVPDPHRQIVLRVVDEAGVWRLAQAPKALVTRVLDAAREAKLEVEKTNFISVDSKVDGVAPDTAPIPKSNPVVTTVPPDDPKP